MAAASFTDTVLQRIDAKGRVSIPAAFRRVLDAGDPDREAGELPSVMLCYGPHLKGHFRGYTVAAHEEAGRLINAIEPTSPEVARRKQMAQKLHFGCAFRLEIEREGRVVMPAARRAALGVEEGELAFRGMGDFFEVWNAGAFAEADADLESFLEAEEGFDPTALPFMVGR